MRALSRSALACGLAAAGASTATSQAAGPLPAPCLVQQVRLSPDDVVAGDAFGGGVAIDGELAIVGAWQQDAQGMSSGSAYAFARSGDAWLLEEKLLGSDALAWASFGIDVALEGETALIGARGVTGDGTAYVFERGLGGWVERRKLKHGQPSFVSGFAQAVAMRADVLVVGSDVAAFVWTGAGASSSQPLRLDPPAGTSISTFFGRDVATDGVRLAVGAPDYNAWAPGWVDVHVRQGAAWKLEARLETAGPLDDGFGSAAAIDGDLLLVGAPRFDGAFQRTGYVAAYVRGPQGWVQEAVLAPNDLTANAHFGTALALQGDVAVIGAPGFEFGMNQRGAACLYHRVDGAWVEHARLLPPEQAIFREFGGSVALSGDTVVVGEPLGMIDEGGAAHVFAPAAALGTRHCACTGGPCGNDDPAAGCANSTGAGARLDAHGTTQPDQVALTVVQAPPGSLALLLEGRNAIQVPFGDGFRCAGGDVVRLHAPRPVAIDGTIEYGPCHGDAPISNVTGVVPGSGDERSYQLWYRDPQGPCSAGFNLSDAVRVSW